MPITFDHVFYTYAVKSPFEYAALRDISLTIEDNSFTAIIGQTGSGKSTLIQHINALLRASSGTITVGDFVLDSKAKKIKKLKELRKYAGLVFQFPEYQLFEETVLKDVAFGPQNFGASEEEAKKKALDALKKVHLDESTFERSPFELSGGQKRRVAIAGIIALEPKVLILDEPTAGLDPQGAKEIMELFKEIHQNGTTIIMVSHDMDIVLEYAERAIVIDGGKVVKDARPSDLFKDDELVKKYSFEEPHLISFAKSLKASGLNIDLGKITSLNSLIDEIKKAEENKNA